MQNLFIHSTHSLSCLYSHQNASIQMSFYHCLHLWNIYWKEAFKDMATNWYNYSQLFHILFTCMQFVSWSFAWNHDNLLGIIVNFALMYIFISIPSEVPPPQYCSTLQSAEGICPPLIPPDSLLIEGHISLKIRCFLAMLVSLPFTWHGFSN